MARFTSRRTRFPPDTVMIFTKHLSDMLVIRSWTNGVSTSSLRTFKRANLAFRQSFFLANLCATIFTGCEVPPVKIFNQTFTKHCLSQRVLLQQSFAWLMGCAR